MPSNLRIAVFRGCTFFKIHCLEDGVLSILLLDGKRGGLYLPLTLQSGIFGFLYSWIGVAVGGTLMFLFWRRIVRTFFWKFASRFPKLEKAQQWVNHFDTASLFMLAVLPFTPTAFMHLAFGISDMDERRYLVTVLLGKGVMVGMMAVFGQSLVSSLKNPIYLILALLIWGGMYWVSKKFCKRHDLD